MRKLLGLMAGLIGILFAGTGCGAMILAHHYAAGLDGPASSAFPLGASRQNVEEKLGEPVKSRALPDGTRVDSYDYIVRDPRWRGACFPTYGERAPSVCNLAILSAVTLGFGEIAFVPLTGYEISKTRRTATFTYDPSGRLLNHGPPPTYGPPDDALGTLSLNEIRERCRAETSREPSDRAGGVTGELPTAPRDLYDQCLVRRLAIWGIE